MSAHTKEPWRVGTCDCGWDECKSGTILAKTGDVVTDVRRVDAEHIVACVNALAGLNPEEVKKLISAVRLLNRTVLAVHDDAHRPDHNGECKCAGCFDIKAVRAALAKLEEVK